MPILPRVLHFLLFLAAGLLVIGTFVTLLQVGWWAVRALDFPRLQIFVLCLVVAAALALTYRNGWPQDGWPRLGLALLVLTLAAAVYQAARILPYTRVWPRQVVTASDPGPDLRLMVANVLMDNRDASRLLAQIQASGADLVVFTEPDAWWAAQLRPLHGTYPHRVEVPLANTYGMIVLSKHPLLDPQVKELFEAGIPSVHTAIMVDSQRVALRFVHPKPPAPSEAKTTTKRDAELVVVAREVAQVGMPAIVAGDLNDVAWSHSTRLFQRLSKTLDPRRGRGLFSTFHASYPFLRWPLDHVFHTEHFALVDLKRLDANGSDHLPIVVTLRFNPQAAAEQAPLTPESDDLDDAQEKVDDARNE